PAIISLNFAHFFKNAFLSLLISAIIIPPFLIAYRQHNKNRHLRLCLCFHTSRSLLSNRLCYNAYSPYTAQSAHSRNHQGLLGGSKRQWLVLPFHLRTSQT